MAELKPAHGRFKAYGIVRDAFGRVKVDDLERIQDPVFRKLIEDAIAKTKENDNGSDSSSSGP